MSFCSYIYDTSNENVTFLINFKSLSVLVFKLGFIENYPGRDLFFLWDIVSFSTVSDTLPSSVSYSFFLKD